MAPNPSSGDEDSMSETEEDDEEAMKSGSGGGSRGGKTYAQIIGSVGGTLWNIHPARLLMVSR